MSNKAFREAYKAAENELESLLKEQERIEERVLSLRKTMNALGTLISQQGKEGSSFMEGAMASLREAIDTSLTHDIHRIVLAAKEPLTAGEIRTELNQLGSSLAEQSNPLATIHAILSRLTESGRAKETTKEGKKAWYRYRSLTELLPPPPDPTKIPPMVSKGSFINYDKSPAPPVRKK